jgi:hypothetical protein
MVAHLTKELKGVVDLTGSMEMVLRLYFTLLEFTSKCFAPLVRAFTSLFTVNFHNVCSQLREPKANI